MLKKLPNSIFLEEKTSKELVTAIFNYKHKNKNSKFKTTIKFILFFIILPLIIFVFNKLSIKISFIHEMMQDFLELLGILIGFTLTALSIVGTGMHKKAVKYFFEYESIASEGHSIYKVILFEFIDYLYSLLATLSFVILAILLYPYAYYLCHMRLVISIIFFYSFAGLIFWNVFSIKSLIYNLYAIFMLNAKAICLSEK